MSSLMSVVKKQIGWELVFVIVLSIILVYVVDPKSVEADSILGKYLQWVYINIPGIRNEINASKFKDVAFLYYPVMLMASAYPLIAHTWRTVSASEMKGAINYFWGSPLKNTFRFIYVAVMCFGMSYFIFFINGQQYNSLPHHESLFYLSIFGIITAGGAAYVLWGMLLRSIYSIITREGMQ